MDFNSNYSSLTLLLPIGESIVVYRIAESLAIGQGLTKLTYLVAVLLCSFGHYLAHRAKHCAYTE